MKIPTKGFARIVERLSKGGRNVRRTKRRVIVRSVMRWASRRVVTGVGEDGRSTVVSTEPTPNIFLFEPSSNTDPHELEGTKIKPSGREFPGLGTLEVSELWIANNFDGPTWQEPREGKFGVESGAGNLRWRVTRFGPHLTRPLHRTNTTDCDLVLEGEVYIVLESEEVLLSQGDFLVLPSVTHGWRTTERGCTLLVSMFGHSESGEKRD
jgi:quercetin dioxygenase-like cupin family protein